MWGFFMEYKRRGWKLFSAVVESPVATGLIRGASRSFGILKLL